MINNLNRETNDGQTFTEFRAQSGINLKGEPTVLVSKYLNGTKVNEAALAGAANASLSWLKNSTNTVQGLVISGQTDLVVNDQNNDGRIDDQDIRLAGRPSDLKVYQLTEAGWQAQRLISNQRGLHN